MAERVKQEFYKSDAKEIAPALLGKILCRRLENGEEIRLRITETECYCGEEDSACHARAGKTNRTAVLYEPGGMAYIYLCYGIHFLFNVVTGEKDMPQAVLIRGVEGFNGPGKLTKKMGIDKSLNRENLITSNRLWIEDDGVSFAYEKTKRIGIDYASEPYKSIEWRFVKK